MVVPAGESTVVGLEGHSVVLGFLVENDNPLLVPDGVEWLVLGAPLNETDVRYSLSPNRLVLTVSKLRLTDEGQYHLTARNAAGMDGLLQRCIRE